MSDQMIFKRYEIKYMLTREQKKRLCHLMKDEMIADGTITIEADSDGIDAEETLQIDGGSMTIAAGDDGVHSDRDLIITDGTIDVSKSYEGLEGMTVTIEDGDISVVSSDDGLNAAGDPADASSDNSDSNESNSDMLNPGEENTNPSTEDDRSDSTANVQTIATTDSTKRGDNNADKSDSSNNKTRPDMNGGTINVNADGDGIDSNGDLIVTDGTIYVSGPTNGGNGALDYAGNAAISGGTIVAVGASGMAQNFGSDSTQGCMLVTVAESTLTGDLTLTDSDGNVIVSYSPEKAYNSVVISSPDIKKGATYTLATGDTTNTVSMVSYNLKGESRIFPVHLKFTSFHYIFLLSECEHRIDAATGFFHNLLIQRNFFSAISEQTVIYIPQCGQLHIVTDTVLGQRIEFLIRALILQMLNNAVLRSDNKFLRIAFSGVIHDTGS